MALEAWAHNRIEAGEAFDIVLDDVLGAGNSPAAYLLIAVDLVSTLARVARRGGAISRMPGAFVHRSRALGTRCPSIP